MSEIFKYSPIHKNSIDALIKGYLYFASVEKLNDPLDCSVDLRGAIKRAINATQGAPGESLQKILSNEDFIEHVILKSGEVGICSFSNNLLKPMMWSHYADEHRGFCLLYNIPDSYIEFSENRIVGSAPVIYEDNGFTNRLIDIAKSLINVNEWEFFEKIVEPLFTAKGKEWEVEDEWRIIRESPGPLPFDRKYLKQICFGMKTPERDIELVREIVGSYNYEISFCQISRSNTDFTLSANDL